MSEAAVATQKPCIVRDFKEAFTDKLDDVQINNTVAQLEQVNTKSLLAATSYSAEGSLISVLFYFKAQCYLNGRGGKTFNGKAGGGGTPGGGALFGDVYLAKGVSLDELYSRTSHFGFTATPVYTAFYFYATNGDFLGHLQAGSVSTVLGSGAGKGEWS